MKTMKFPIGFNLIPAGEFRGASITPFGFKQTPVTNKEWDQDVQAMLSKDRFLLLRHNWNTLETKLEKKGRSIEEVWGGPVFTTEDINFDKGNVMMFGSAILVKMVENPSTKYDEQGSVFSGINQPVVGISYFHAKAWCLLKTWGSNGKFKYDLPTDDQYEYVASGRYDVQATSTVWRWTRLKSEFHFNFTSSHYGLRRGSWSFDRLGGSDIPRLHPVPPDHFYRNVSFSPVVII